MKKVATSITFFVGILSLLFVILEFFLFYNEMPQPLSGIIIAKYIVALYSIACGIFCSFFYAENINTRQIVIFLYTFGIALVNFFSSINTTPFYNKPIILFFDIFGLSTSTCILLFLSKNLHHYAKYKTINKIITISSHLPTILIIFKLILILSNKKYTIISNPLLYMTHFICVLLCVLSIGIFIFLIVNSTRQSSMLLRYVSLGVFYSLTPSIILFMKGIFFPSHIIPDVELVSITTALSFLPTIIVLSIFQYKNEKINYIIRIILTFLGFSTLMVFLLQLFYEAFSYSFYKTITAIMIISAPYIYLSIKKPVQNFLTLENKTVKQEFKKYGDSLQCMNSLHNIYLLTAKEIKRILNCKFLFFYTFRENHWYIPYTDTDEKTCKRLIELSKQSHSKKLVQVFDDNSACFLIFLNNRPSIRLFVGPKQNEDPYLPSEFIFTQKYLDLMVNRIIYINSINISTELEEVSQHSQQMDKEIRLAAIIQQNFYPQNIKQFEGWNVQFYSKAMAGVSGDLYDFYYKDNTLNGLGIFDVSGHGISSGLVTMMVRNIIQRVFHKHLDLPLNEVVKIIDSRFREEKKNIENFMTGILLRFSDDNIQMVNAGHPYPYIYRKATNQILSFDKIDNTHSSVIGFNYFESEFLKSEFKMESGDILYLFTDGITEAKNPSKEQYGNTRLLKAIQDTINESPQEQINSILADVNTFVGSEPANDDITLIILKKE